MLFGDLSLPRTTGCHISLVFREMWDTRTFMFLAGSAENRPVERRGLPHLAKNERDVGHPVVCGTITKNTRILALLRKVQQVRTGSRRGLYL